MSDDDDHSERPSKRQKRADDDDEDVGSDDDGSDEEVIGKDGKKSKGKGGSSCHQCKSRRNFGALTYCTSNLDKKNKKCRKKFCGHCLKKFYKESAIVPDKTTWKCPSCRKICCCAACRRRKTKDVGKGGDDDGSPIQQKPKKPVKTSNYDHGQHQTRKERGTGDSTDVLYHPASSSSSSKAVHGDDEGYPAPSRRSERSLMHATRSPRMSGSNGSTMSDTSPSPARGGGGKGKGTNFDLVEGHGGDEYENGEGHHHSSSDSESDSDAAASDTDVQQQQPNVLTSGAQHYMNDDDDDPSSSLPSSQFTSLLSTHIKSLAEESVRTPNSAFSRLYQQAQQIKIKKKIKAILLRADIKKEKKVELIAALLAPLEEQPPQDEHSSSASTPQAMSTGV